MRHCRKKWIVRRRMSQQLAVHPKRPAQCLSLLTDAAGGRRTAVNSSREPIASERPLDRSTGDKQSDSGGGQRRQRRHPLGYYCQRLSEWYLVNLPNSRTLPSNRKLNRLVAVYVLDRYFWVKTICCLCELITMYCILHPSRQRLPVTPSRVHSYRHLYLRILVT